MNRRTSLCRALEAQLSTATPADFSGFGLVIYGGSISDIPTSPLILNANPASPINNEQEIAELLIRISRYSDVHHDGFHFVHQGDGLTSLCRFVSPPIPVNYRPTQYDVGARHRAAELISNIEAVEAVIVVGKTGRIQSFVRGQLEGGCDCEA